MIDGTLLSRTRLTVAAAVPSSRLDNNDPGSCLECCIFQNQKMCLPLQPFNCAQSRSTLRLKEA